MKAVLRESPRVGALGLYALPLSVYLQQQMHTLSADASATLHHYLAAMANVVTTGLLQQANLQVTHTVQQCCSPMFEMRLAFYKRDMTMGNLSWTCWA